MIDFYDYYAQCECCGREDVDLVLVRVNTYYCKYHLKLFTDNWDINPNLYPFEKLQKEPQQ